MRLLPTLLVLSALAAAANAQPATATRGQPQPTQQPAPQSVAPRTRPSRDVVVSYRMEGQALSMIPGGIQGPVTLSWDAAGQRVRAEAEGRSQVALIDLNAQSGQAIDTTLRIVLPLPIRPSDLGPLSLDGARLAPKGKETIAGLSCTAYTFESSHGPGTVCLTPDGVPLRGQGSVSGKPGSFTALSVRYGALSGGLFTVPQGYMALGGGSGGSASGLAGLAQKFGGVSGLSDLKALLGRAK